MKRLIGMGVGIAYFGLAFISLRKAGAGWNTGYEDLGFWWTVIAVILTIAATGALVGTWMHTRKTES